MGLIQVDQSIKVKESLETVDGILSDFSSWPMWSPWIITDPKAKVEFAKDKKSYSWSGKRMGSGNIALLPRRSESEYNYKLIIKKPLKIIADVRFLVLPEDDGLTLKWQLDSSLPFFMFGLKKTIQALLNIDYHRGLLMLKDYLELGVIPSVMEYQGKTDFGPEKYLGIQTECAITDINPNMDRDMHQLRNYFQEHDITSSGSLFSVYHVHDPVKNSAVYTCAFPVETFPENVPDTMLMGTLPARKAYVINHIGPYHHLGNAWSTADMMQRNAEFVRTRKMDPFEMYITDPDKEQDPTKLQTKVCFPVR